MPDFEAVTRQKIRFDTPQGVLTVEDLWKLPLTGTGNQANLDQIGMNLANEIKKSETQSLVKKPTTANARLQLAYDTVVHIINVRLAEAEQKENAEKVRAQRDDLTEILQMKEREVLLQKTPEEIRAMRDALPA